MRLTTFVLMGFSILASSFLLGEIRRGNHWATVAVVNIVAFGVLWLVRRKRQQQSEIKPTAEEESGEAFLSLMGGIFLVILVITVSLLGHWLPVWEW